MTKYASLTEIEQWATVALRNGASDRAVRAIRGVW